MAWAALLLVLCSAPIHAGWNLMARRQRAEGAFLVCAQRQSGQTRAVEIISEKGGVCRLENPFESAEYVARGVAADAIREDGNELVIETIPGQKITFTRKSR